MNAENCFRQTENLYEEMFVKCIIFNDLTGEQRPNPTSSQII